MKQTHNLITPVRRTSRYAYAAAVAAALVALGQSANAQLMVESLGNTTPGFANGSFPPLIPDVLNAQTGQPAPFNAGIGSDPAGPNFSATWTFNYAAIVLPDQIQWATIEIGIYDHDSAYDGNPGDAGYPFNQTAVFTAEGVDHTTAMGTLMESYGGSYDPNPPKSPEYNVYSLSLSPSTFASLADGSATFQLDLQGPVFSAGLFGDQVDPFNGAHLIYSKLTLNVIPEPSSYGFALGIVGLLTVIYRRRAKR